MEEILNEYILPHWPFWGSMLIFAMMGQTMKSVFTKEMAEKSAFARIFRATLQIHPVLAGLVIGWSNMLPASGGVESAGGKALYFGASGVLSSWLFYAIKRYLKKKGVDLPTGVPSMPPPKPDDDEDDDSSSNSDPPDSASDPPESSEPPADSDPPKSDSDPPASEDEDAEGGAEKRDSEPPADKS